MMVEALRVLRFHVKGPPRPMSNGSAEFGSMIFQALGPRTRLHERNGEHNGSVAAYI